MQDTQVQTPIRELRSHMWWSNWSYAPQLLDPPTLEPKPHNWRAHEPQQRPDTAK